MDTFTDHDGQRIEVRLAPSGLPAPEASPDRQLVDRCIAGDRQAWAEFVDRWQRHIRYCVIQQLRRREQLVTDDRIDDLASRVLLRCLDHGCRALASWRGDAGLRRWLSVMVANLVVDDLRRSRRALMVTLDTTACSPTVEQAAADLALGCDGPEQALERSELTELVADACDRLEGIDRELVRLHLVEGLAFEHIARELGTTTGALYTRKSRLLHRIRDDISRRIDDRALA